jgi:exonuclease SbcC
MKPIKLKIAGLHSFREPQVIDFDRLCETGVFGIFGPTGSGKSTILDAITLALYGKVERAPHNTQGILNHAEDGLMVEFVFELGNRNLRNRYMVQRGFVRGEGVQLKSSACRLVQFIDGRELVLADRPSEITGQVEKLLGLNVDDFTRAVVLPQGKFSEFLSLKGKERRQMLERLFNLEQYGDLLNQRLSQRLNSVSGELQGIIGEQKGLGDASEEAVKMAEKKFLEARAMEIKSAEFLKKVEEEYEKQRQLWEWQQELAEVIKARRQLDLIKDEIALKAGKLDAALRAEGIRPYLNEVKEAEDSLMKAKKDLDQAVIELERSKEKVSKTLDSFEKVSQKRNRDEPLLIETLAKLEQAKNYEEELIKLRGIIKGLQEEYERVNNSRKVIESRLEEICRQRDKDEESMKNLKEKLDRFTVTPEYRLQIGEAFNAKQSYLSAEKLTRNLEEDLKTKIKELEQIQNLKNKIQEEVRNLEEKLENLKVRLSEMQANKPGDEGSLAARMKEIALLRSSVEEMARCEKELDFELTAQNKKEKELKEAKEEYELIEKDYNRVKALCEETGVKVKQLEGDLKEFEQQNLASRLAETLYPGKPCPVCGSIHHPSPAEIVDDSLINELRARIERAKREEEDLKRELNDRIASLTNAAAKTRSMEYMVDSGKKAVEEKKMKLKGLKERLPGDLREKDTASILLILDEREKGLLEESRNLQDWQTKIEELRTEIEKSGGLLSQNREKFEGVKSTFIAGEKAIKEVKARIEEARRELAAAVERLTAARGEVPVEDIEKENSKIQNWDKLAADLGKKIRGLEAKVRETEEAIENLTSQKNELEIRINVIKSEGKQQREKYDDLKTKLEEITEGKPVQALIDEKTKILNSLREMEKQIKKEHEEALKLFNTAQENKAGAERAFKLSNERFTKAKTKLHEAVKEAGFNSVREAEDSLSDAKQREKWRLEVEEYRQKETALEEDRRKLEHKLGGRCLTREEWDEWQNRLEKAKESYQRAVSERGGAKLEYESSKEKHTKWIQLEKRRQALETQESMLKELQTVLRGNAFVEFIAEEQLIGVALDASAILGKLTKHRYALEVDSSGAFIMRDDANGGVKRPVTTLSGGETFLTSLALALALSSQIQLKGEYPLEFFFLDEGFGTLDSQLLEVVMDTLERLHEDNLTVGIISHVPELKNRLARRLIVDPAQPGGRGTRVKIEIA